MNSKNKLNLAIGFAIASASGMSAADITPLSESQLASMTGQAGITIEINSAEITIGEVQYKDEGSIFMDTITLTGAGTIEQNAFGTAYHNTKLDNLKITIDVVGNAADAASIEYGLNKIDGTDGATIAVNTTTYYDPNINDGDLVIGIDAIDQGDGIDFGFLLGGVTLGESAYSAGDGEYLRYAGSNTVLMQNVEMIGSLGPVDIVIDGNNGGMNINGYIDLNGYVEMPFVATQFNFRLHNFRGNDVFYAELADHDAGAYDGDATKDFLSGAHFQVDIGAAGDSSKGIYMNVLDFSGDMDITNIHLGSAPSIGDLYMTDLAITADMNVYGH